MAKKEEQVEVVAAEVVEDRVTKDIAKREDAAQRTVIKKTIARQVATVQGVELRSNFEKLKLGAMVSEAVRVLKLEDAQTGRGHAGGGALGWWADVCPRDKDGKPVIAYKTVMMWKEAADNLAGHLRHIGPGKLEEDIIEVLAKNPKKAVGKDAKILASAEKLANGMTMRQMLLWGDDEPAKGKGGRPKATDEELPKLNKRDEAKAIWNVLLQHVTKTSVKDAVPLLPQKETQIAYDTLRDVAELLKAHLGEF